VTTHKSTGYSPYYMTHGVEPLLPFDITEATFMLPDVSALLFTSELIVIRAQQLMKHDNDLAEIHAHILKARFTSVTDFERHFAHALHDYDFQPGALVLVLNKKIEAASNAKCRPRYFGPMVVVSRTAGGSYHLAELDGTILRLKFAAFCIIPYHSHSASTIEVTQYLNTEDFASIAPVQEELSEGH
jgi:hypothetical protein